MTTADAPPRTAGVLSILPLPPQQPGGGRRQLRRQLRRQQRRRRRRRRGPRRPRRPLRRPAEGEEGAGGAHASVPPHLPRTPLLPRGAVWGGGHRAAAGVSWTRGWGSRELLPAGRHRCWGSRGLRPGTEAGLGPSSPWQQGRCWGVRRGLGCRVAATWEPTGCHPPHPPLLPACLPTLLCACCGQGSPLSADAHVLPPLPPPMLPAHVLLCAGQPPPGCSRSTGGNRGPPRSRKVRTPALNCMCFCFQRTGTTEQSVCSDTPCSVSWPAGAVRAGAVGWCSEVPRACLPVVGPVRLGAGAVRGHHLSLPAPRPV